MTADEIRHRFRLALLAYVVLAIACVAGIAYNYAQQSELKDHQAAISEQLGQIERNQAAILRLTVNSAAAICLEAFAVTPQQRQDLVRRFNLTGHISLDDNTTCKRAVAQAVRLIGETP